MIPADAPPIVLASRSPRRRALLEQIGVRYALLDDDGSDAVDEAVHDGEMPETYVQRVTRAKADVGWSRLLADGRPRGPLLAADTAVVVDQRILGKPADRADAARMLRLLSARTHEVLTGVALHSGEHCDYALSRSRVTFRRLDADEIRDYLATGEADDKAGAYAIQGRAAQFVVALEGSFSGVMGLPLYETAQLLEARLRAESAHAR
ncbi:MAG TPA: Maf family protein [Burkholderiales bacterium]|nr:Maf family protein [Burkholderiales bacterium]